MGLPARSKKLALDTQHGIVEQFSRSLIWRRLLPVEEVNDSYILGETAIAEIPILITSDHHLLDIEPSALSAAFEESDLRAVSPMHPRRFVRAVLQS